MGKKTRRKCIEMLTVFLCLGEETIADILFSRYAK